MFLSLWEKQICYFGSACLRNNTRLAFVIIMYLYSAQYLHKLQDSKRYITNPTAQVQPQLTSN